MRRRQVDARTLRMLNLVGEWYQLGSERNRIFAEGMLHGVVMQSPALTNLVSDLDGPSRCSEDVAFALLALAVWLRHLATSARIVEHLLARGHFVEGTPPAGGTPSDPKAVR